MNDRQFHTQSIDYCTIVPRLIKSIDRSIDRPLSLCTQFTYSDAYEFFFVIAKIEQGKEANLLTSKNYQKLAQIQLFVNFVCFSFYTSFPVYWNHLTSFETRIKRRENILCQELMICRSVAAEISNQTEATEILILDYYAKSEAKHIQSFPQIVK